MTRRIFRFAFLIASLAASVHAAGQSAVVTGTVIDSVSRQPLGYATIALHTAGDDKLVNGNISGDDGKFSVSVAPGRYYAEINYVGYRRSRTPAFDVGAPSHNLGVIVLSPTEDILDEVVVQGEKSSMELALDKRIFNVGKDLANSGGTASDILANIPSVAVDPEGNIRLRGSDNVRILIDGKPSGLVSFGGGSGLQQLQANMVERVEVITNPSARYEAEGLGGIINIVLKKEKNQGFNGSIDVITGYPVNYGLAANLNYRHRKLNFFINYGLSYRDQPGVGSIYQEVEHDGGTAYLLQNNASKIRGLNNNIRGGVDYYFTEKSVITGSYLFRRSDYNRITDIEYSDYEGSLDNLVQYSTRRQDETEDEPNSEYSLIYKRSFEQKGHELLAEVKLLDNRENSDQTFTQQFYLPDGAGYDSLEKSFNVESDRQLLFQLDYTRPVGKEGKFETGIRHSVRDMMNDYIVTARDRDGGFVPLPGLDNIFYYDEDISAAYVIAGNKYKRLSYQGGLRAEWTDVVTTLAETNEVNPRRYYNFFPSVHVTLSMPRENSMQVSYSRRVRRPFYNDLSPFVTYSDNRNFFSGNPDLDPEFSDVYDLGHIKYFDKGSVSSSLFARFTRDKIDNIRRVDENGFSTTVTENLRSEQAWGIDIAGSVELTRWWKLDGNLNFFYAKIDASNIDDLYTATARSWFARQTSRFVLPAKMEGQLRANYEAPQRTAQGTRKGLYYADVLVSRDIFKGNGTVNLSVLDVFNSRRVRSTAFGETFYTERDFQFRRRQFNLILNYRIKRSKAAGRQKREETVTE